MAACLLMQRPKVVTEAWQRVLDMQKAGQVVATTIDTVNRGGVIIKLEGIQGAQCRSSVLVALLAAPGSL